MAIGVRARESGAAGIDAERPRQPQVDDADRADQHYQSEQMDDVRHRIGYRGPACPLTEAGRADRLGETGDSGVHRLSAARSVCRP